jgi:hypothetical protein
MMSGSYHIIRYWSIAAGCRVARIGLTDKYGQEHFATVPMAQLRGRLYRDKLDAVLDRVQSAIDDGQAPGEVDVG